MVDEDEGGWISVRNWRKFQHYDPAKRNVLWVKNYTDLTRRDEYLSLTAGERALLHGIWLEYASTHAELRFSAKSMSRRLNLRVTRQQLQRLVNAGFIAHVASKSLANGYQDASPEEEKEEKDTAVNPGTNGRRQTEQHNPEEGTPEPRITELLEQTASSLRRITP